MDLRIKRIFCGNPDCIGVGPVPWGKRPKRVIVIESKWISSQETVEASMPGMISHETIEYLLLRIEYEEIAENSDAPMFDLHALTGSNQKIGDYIGSPDGVVFRHYGKKVKDPWRRTRGRVRWPSKR